VIVGFVGFSHIEIVHNAAHDTRHANAFPCH
jgi:cobalt transporter subunit CbtB